MNKLVLALVTSAFVGTSLSAFAADDMKHSKDMMKMMDANGDGMIAKDEFMKHHEKMYESMKKNKDGMVDMKDMQMMHDGMMKDNAMMKDKDKMAK
jgi:Ca2+-binding EF-hand superfamily protein